MDTVSGTEYFATAKHCFYTTDQEVADELDNKPIGEEAKSRKRQP